MPAVNPACSACWTSRSSWAGLICSCEQWKPMTVMAHGIPVLYGAYVRVSPSRELPSKGVLVFGSFTSVAELMNRQILLRRRPTGLVAPGDTELVSTPAPEPAEGEALIRTTYVGIDAAARTWLNDQPGYLPPVQIGEVIRAAGIGEVVASRCDAYAVGDVVTTLTCFQEYVICRDDIFTTPVPGPRTKSTNSR